VRKGHLGRRAHANGHDAGLRVRRAPPDRPDTAYACPAWRPPPRRQRQARSRVKACGTCRRGRGQTGRAGRTLRSTRGSRGREREEGIPSLSRPVRSRRSAPSALRGPPDPVRRLEPMSGVGRTKRWCALFDWGGVRPHGHRTFLPRSGESIRTVKRRPHRVAAKVRGGRWGEVKATPEASVWPSVPPSSAYSMDARHADTTNGSPRAIPD
jgi:hypothetical protein